jgi:hypothetical protein
LLAILVLASCAPSTPVRRSAIVPAPTVPSRTGRPLDGREMRGSLELNPFRFVTEEEATHSLVAVPGDPGLFVPRAQIGASFYGSPVRGLELGGQFRYGPMAWSDANKVGVLPFPSGQGRDSLHGGIGVRGNWFLDGFPGSLSLLGELNVARVCQARFVCEGDKCDSGYYMPEDPTGTFRNGKYRFDGIQETLFLLPSLFASFQIKAWEWFHFFAMLGTERSVTNVGFESDASKKNASSLTGMWLVVPAVGVDFEISHFYTTATFFYPCVVDQEVRFGPSLTWQVGTAF